jgi:hypothetical protein
MDVNRISSYCLMIAEIIIELYRKLMVLLAAGEGQAAGRREQAASSSSAPRLSQLSALRCLHVQYHNAAMESLTGVLQHLPALTELSLVDCCSILSAMQQLALTTVAAAAQTASQLTSLHLSCDEYAEADPWFELLDADVLDEVISSDLLTEAVGDVEILTQLSPLLPPTGQPFASLQHLHLLVGDECQRIHDGVWEALRGAAQPGGALPALTHLKVYELALYRSYNSSTTAATAAADLPGTGSTCTLQRLTLDNCSLRTLGNLPLGENGGVQHLTFGTLYCDLARRDTGMDVDFLQLLATTQMSLTASAVSNLTCCGDSPCCHAPSNGRLTLWYDDVPTLEALLQVLPYVEGVRSLKPCMGDFSAAHMTMLAAAPVLPPSITTLDLTAYLLTTADDAWSVMLPSLTTSPSLAGVREVVVHGDTAREELQAMCCVPGVARHVVVRVSENLSIRGSSLSAADVQHVRNAVATAGMSHLVTIDFACED